MIINHNMAAMNAQRQFGINRKKTEKNMEKLSSGYKINRAGDDAARLAISEKMRGQIRGLDRASKNMEDAVSLVQVADGAMQEVSDILQRTRQLSVQAANDTNTDEDREDIQMEIDKLSQEITRISEQTEFNTRKILQGKKEKTVIIETPISIGDISSEGYQTASIPDWVLGTNENYPSTETTMTGYLTEDVTSDTVYYKTTKKYNGATGSWSSSGKNLVTQQEKEEYVSGITSYKRVDSGNGSYDQVEIVYRNGNKETKALSSVSADIRNYLEKNINNQINYEYEKGGNRAGAFLDFSNVNKENVFELVNEEFPQAFNSTCCTCDAHYSITFVGSGGNRAESSGKHQIYSVDISDILERAKAGIEVKGEEIVDKILSAISQGGSTWSEKGEVRPGGHFTVYGKDDVNKNCLVIYDYRKNMTAGNGSGKFEWGIYRDSGYSNNIEVSRTKVIEKAEWLRIQTGANAGQELAMVLPEISLEELGILDLNVTSHDDAAFCLDRIDNAVNYLNGERARMGAYQNRLEYSISRVDTASENLSASESRIRDTDMADQMTEYAKDNILSQAGQAMLSNANSNTDHVIALLEL